MTKLVLIVDDSHIARCGTALTLSKLLSYEVLEATDGCSAINVLKEKSCAAVLMDCEMPEMSGFECTEQIRELEKATGKRTPIIGLTCITHPDIADKCLQAGMDDYLDKGCSVEELHKTIQKWIV